MQERFRRNPSLLEKVIIAVTGAWWLYEAFTWAWAAQHRLAVAPPSILVTYQLWTFFSTYYELEETSLLKREGLSAERIPYASMLDVREMLGTSRYALLQRGCVEIDYRDRKGNYATLKLYPAMAGDFAAQLNDRRQRTVYRPNL